MSNTPRIPANDEVSQQPDGRSLADVLDALFPPSPPGLLDSAELLLEGRHAYEREHPDTVNHVAQGLGAKKAAAKRKGDDLSPRHGLSPPQSWGLDGEPDDEEVGAPGVDGHTAQDEGYVSLVAARAKERGYKGSGRSTIFEKLKWAERIDPVVKAEVRGSKFENATCLKSLARQPDLEGQLALLASWRDGTAETWSGAPFTGERVKGFVDTPTRFFFPDITDAKGHVLVPSIEFRCGDSREELKVLYDEARRFDLVATDPPFGVDRKDSDERTLANDNDPVAIAPWAVDMCLAVLRDDCPAFLCASDQVYPRWVWEGEALKRLKHDATYVGAVTWFKQQGSGLGSTDSTFNPETESILVIHKGRPKLHAWTNLPRLLSDHENAPLERFEDIKDDDLRQRDGNHWSIASPRGAGPGDLHPTRKPVALGMRIALNATKEGDEWLDPFAGCCPFGVAAVRLRRRYLGIELDPDFFAEGVWRLKAALVAKYPERFGLTEELAEAA